MHDGSEQRGFRHSAKFAIIRLYAKVVLVSKSLRFDMRRCHRQVDDKLSMLV